MGIKTKRILALLATCPIWGIFYVAIIFVLLIGSVADYGFKGKWKWNWGFNGNGGGK